MLGFRVEDCGQALGILKKTSFELKQNQGHTLLKIEAPAHINEVVRLLNANGLACEVTDVAQGMYQG